MTQPAPAIDDDSAEYLTAAESLLAGQGWIAPSPPLTHGTGDPRRRDASDRPSRGGPRKPPSRFRGECSLPDHPSG